jgi:glycosyltransferase involved in cell wall biosynthesis
MSVQVQHFRLSVLLVTYNHKKYIRQALESLFRQVVQGVVELVVADDGSSDGTLDIIREHEQSYPRFQFKYLNCDVNLGITKNYQRGFAACSGEYIAVLEGDDYWVSPFKLQRQCEFLDAHWECELCAVNYFVYEEDRAQFTPRTKIGQGHRFLGPRDLIADPLASNFSTCLYRKTAIDSLPQDLFEVTSYDWIVNICVARHGLVGFLEEPMSVYRLHSGGVWTQKSKIEKLQAQLDLIPSYDALTDRLFHSEFETQASVLRTTITALRVERVTGSAVKQLARIPLNLSDYLPPILRSLIAAIVPPAIKRVLKRVLLRNRST